MEIDMKTVWKFVLKAQGEQKVEMPLDSVVLSVQAQGQEACMWALVDSEKEKVVREFFVCGTGFECLCDASEFVGTFQIDSDLVFHLFEKKVSN